MSTTAEARYARRLERLKREYERMSSLLSEATSRYAELQTSLEDAFQQALARYYDKQGTLDAALEKKTAECACEVLPLLTHAQLLEELKRRLH